ncbi:mitochondrial inner membrane protein OXA1-like [Salvia miltiorrhiza]|uniref:mitochondrial inner membrane protein OXA1-like n=1 Tax=Salvia miltiorrhiza TaxID=226208 RepID=UPI0025AC6AA2|nr:mitochondrial inner membrane protein OXA1-like [Salvia miltiorrhiza]XP_057809992.1 mitochondrial inner membrane protein OXA1-like [Salvia miltiorrhiza]
MALRRSVPARAKLFYQQQRVAVPLSHVDRDDVDRENLPRHNPIYKGSGIPDILRRRLQLGAGANVGCFYGSRNLFQDRRFAIPAAFSPVSVRKLSTLGDVVEEMVTSEVAAAAADSFRPVAAIQYLTDYVHTLTGLNWWAAIVMTTILYRTLILPFTIRHTIAASKFTLIKPQLDEILKKKKSGVITLAESQALSGKLYKKYDVTPFTPVNGILFGGPVFLCFIFAINNMAVKVQSFKEGGVFWFTDLTTPDAIHILPVLTALTCWIMMKRNTQQGVVGDPGAIFFASTVLAILTIPATEYFPKAICCYWITSHLYTIAYGLVIKKPEVKQMLGIPDIPQPPPLPPNPSFSDALKGFILHMQLNYNAPPSHQSLSQLAQSLPPPPPVDEASKLVDPRIRSLASAAARIKNLEKELKREKKGNKRSSR